MEQKKASRVLIVDDMPVNRMILSSLLASHGVSSDLAGSGQECLDLCSNNSYDLILLDHRMPEIDGVDTLTKLKEMFRRSGREVPVVCHTTEDARKNINLYKAAGFADVLIKPIQPQSLSEVLMTYLPEGNTEAESENEVVNSAIEKELSLLPKWLFDVEGLNLNSGLEHCETAEDYLDALTVFVSSVPDKAKEIEKFAGDQNWPMYTLRVHSLKSIARLVGAEKFSDDAAELEYAGKHGDLATLLRKTPQLLKDYRAFDKALSPLRGEPQLLQSGISQVSGKDPVIGEAGNLPEGEKLPDVDKETLKDAYESLSEFASCYDSENMEMVLKSLSGYILPEADKEKLNTVKMALNKSDWSKIREIFKNTAG